MARRVLLLITDLEIGGTPTVVYELATRLRANCHVEVACLAGDGPVAARLREAGIAVTPLNAACRYDLRVPLRLLKLIRRRRFDTVFSFLLHANAVAALLGPFCLGVRFIQSIQTTQPHPRWHWQLQRLIRAAARWIVVPSRSVAQAAQNRSGIPAARIIVIPNAVDPGRFEASPLPLRDDRPYPIGFLGRLDPVKRLGDLIDATRRLDGLVHLHIFGDGPDRPLAQSAQGPQITFHGLASSPHEALKQIGLLVLPSLAEGFGLVLIEAMAAGVPVVARDVPGVRDVVRDGQTGLLAEPSSVAALAAAIARIVEDRPLRLRLIEEARRDVAGRFTWSRIITQYRDLLGV